MEKGELLELFENAFPFWHDISQHDRDTVMNSAVEVTFKGGTNVHDGNECTGVILIKRGSLRLYMLSEEGKEITLYRLFPGDICILSASCVLEMLTFDVYIDSEEDSECVVVGGCIIEQLSQKNKDVKIFVLETALSRFSDVMWVMEQILFMSMDKRLAIFLLDEAAKAEGSAIKLTHEQIAKYMGSAREVVTRMLKYFVSEGLVSYSRSEGIKILNKQALRALSR